MIIVRNLGNPLRLHYVRDLFIGSKQIQNHWTEMIDEEVEWLIREKKGIERNQPLSKSDAQILRRQRFKELRKNN